VSRVYVGIDNGLSGALVAISDHPGPPIDMLVMPTRGKTKGNEVDAARVIEWLQMLAPLNTLSVVLETPGKHSPGVQALCSMWDSYGALRGVLEAFRIRHHRVSPQTWQKVMLPNCAKGDTKPAALAKCRQLWPDETWLRTPRSKTMDHNLIDAALIAEYGRIKNL